MMQQQQQMAAMQQQQMAAMGMATMGGFTPHPGMPEMKPREK